MTSRLKRKLNDLGVDPTSAKANESFCLIGTPLPPLEKSKDTGEFVPLWKQEVRDEKGRRRLHGAFTGGFSAGYFNTVGTKEGWAPSTFVSSRSDRAKQRLAKPEDFMDEEDLAELQESRKLVDEHDEMDFGGTEAELRRRTGANVDEEPDSISTALEASLAPAPKDSVGARILKKMGWRLGQGIGPRLTYAQRKAQDAGVLDSWKETTGEEENDEEAKKHMYPRRDTPVLLAPRKDNFHGLGYVPGMRLQEALGQEEAREKGPTLAAGFGLGALNDADEDDLDVYEGGRGRHGRTRMAYDAAHVDDDSHIIMGSSSARSRGQQSKVTTVASVQTFSDGRTVLKGFVLSDRPVAEDRWFALPEVPKGWTPNPRRVWDKNDHDENVDTARTAVKHPPKTHGDWKSSFISADQRGSMLGETPLPSQPRSVFEYMSQKDRERLQNIRNVISAPSAPSAATPSAAPPPSEHIRGQLDIPHLHPSIAKAALQGFQPFTADPVKQSRYTTFLNFQANREPADTGPVQLGIGPTQGQSIDDFNKELVDYAKAATVFKPLSAAMAGRFRSAVIVESGPTIIEGLHKPDFSTVKEEEGAKEEDEKKEEDPRMAAVRVGMYGPLTRDVQPWQPARLLCKRFGVKEPEVEMDSATAGPSTADFAPTASAKQADMTSAESSGAGAGAGAVSAGMITDGSSGEKREGGPRNLANVGLGEDDDQGRDTLTYQRPAMDIFKAIFASDDEESEAEAEDEGPDAAEEHDAGSVAPTEMQVKSEPVPVHLLLKDGPAPSYDTQQNGTASGSASQEKVDIASFKPTFIPRSDRESRADKGKGKHKQDKEKKKKTASKALMSFDVDDGMESKLGAPETRRHKDKDKDKDRERKKKKRKEHKEKDDDESMWVEKPPPEAAKVQRLQMEEKRALQEDGREQ
ncbi:G patch domain-containing protein [Sparassis crispa]|uniref:G patch domain-containing protein n=1 Tax=Sparassis crispa TaxID=139825 RepID=A0A401GWU9_9APHY|nr:G patch domain-containing protein [Sparassis crispa]GBE86697.1 G patch domain-containing protein [Sparassis crispa]